MLARHAFVGSTIHAACSVADGKSARADTDALPHPVRHTDPGVGARPGAAERGRARGAGP